MAYITREDGERFVIPSYRDVLSKRKGVIKNDILALSAQYGEYMSLHRRGMAQFEVAFSHEAGFLFGECIWYHFRRPADMIYCEAIPDTTEAYLVIVKDSLVYLDGIFTLENIPEELVIFTTQKNNFEIHVYGEVPLSQEPTDGKFAFDPTSVKSFEVLDAPVFATVPTVKAYQLQLVDVVLRQHGIGVFPVRYVLAVAVVLGLFWMGYTYFSMHKQKPPEVKLPPPVNPFLAFNNALMTPSPDAEVLTVLSNMQKLTTIPGWLTTNFTYSNGKMLANVRSLGAQTNILFYWAKMNQATVNLANTGYSLTFQLMLPPNRGVPRTIYSLERVVSSLVDRIATIMPGNVLEVGAITNKKAYKEVKVSIKVREVSPELLMLIAGQLTGLPLVLSGMEITMNHGYSGSIDFLALGN